MTVQEIIDLVESATNHMRHADAVAYLEELRELLAFRLDVLDDEGDFPVDMPEDRPDAKL